MIDFLNSLVEQYGQLSIFLLTVGDHFILPFPTDPFVTLGLANGLDPNRMAIYLTVAILVGSMIGYYLGRWLGHPVILWLFGKKKTEKAEAFVQKWGIWAVILAGFTPIPFNMTTWVTGAFELSKKKFLLGTIVSRVPRYLALIYGSYWFFETGFYATEEMKALILGLVQGVTEFLPISSSGHLVLVGEFLDPSYSKSQMATFDIFLHGGSLLAIVLYFWKDWWNILKESGRMLKKRHIDHQSTTFKLVLATVPAIVAALMVEDLLKGSFRSLTSVAIFFILTGTFFFYSAWKGKKSHLQNVGLKKAVMIGFAQTLALIPGVSRAGATISTGVILGIKRDVAAKFSFLLGGVAILAANVYELLSLGGNGTMPDLNFTLIGFFSSFTFSLVSVYFLMQFLKKYTLRAFGVYLILMGATILSFL